MASNMSRRNWCADEVSTALTLRRAGVELNDIASRLGRSKIGLCKVLNANGIYQPKGRHSQDLDGPAIGPTADDRRRVQDAHFGSQRLLAAIQVAGVRP
jgi:hypothetical protein